MLHTENRQRMDRKQRTEKPITEAPLIAIPMERQVEWANIKFNSTQYKKNYTFKKKSFN